MLILNNNSPLLPELFWRETLKCNTNKSQCKGNVEPHCSKSTGESLSQDGLGQRFSQEESQLGLLSIHRRCAIYTTPQDDTNCSLLYASPIPQGPASSLPSVWQLTHWGEEGTSRPCSQGLLLGCSKVKRLLVHTRVPTRTEINPVQKRVVTVEQKQWETGIMRTFFIAILNVEIKKGQQIQK